MTAGSTRTPGVAPPCTISAAGSGGLLVDAGSGAFDAAVQRHVWTAAQVLDGVEGVLEAVPGMNNLLVLFDPLAVEPARLVETVRAIWARGVASEVVGKTVEIPVRYGGADGEDLADWAAEPDRHDLRSRRLRPRVGRRPYGPRASRPPALRWKAS